MFFRVAFSRLFLGFSKWTKINVQNSFPFSTFGTKSNYLQYILKQLKETMGDFGRIKLGIKLGIKLVSRQILFPGCFYWLHNQSRFVAIVALG